MLGLAESPSVALPKPRPKIPFAIFATAYLGIKLYPWQVKALTALELKPVSAVICNGGGKSSVIIASAILGFLYNFPKGQCAVTSGSNLQLENQLWPALEKYKALEYFKNWTWVEKKIRTGDGGFAQGFSTNDQADRLEGWHEDLPFNIPVMYIVDEAKAISDLKYQGIGRCTPTYYGQWSSAGAAQGMFYQSFNKLSRFFYTLKVTSKDCPHISDERREFDKAYLDPATYRAKHLSEFDADLSGSAIKLEVINTALARQASFGHLPGARVAFCDFAAGGAENVIALKDGNKVIVAAAWREENPVQGCRQFIEHFKRLGLQASEIYADVGGMGVVMCSNLNDMGWRVNEVNNGAAAEDSEHYSNRGSEIWFEAALAIERGQIIIPDDKLFIEQATDRRRQYDNKQRLMIEPKKDLVGRGVNSPDRADAVLGAITCKSVGWTASQIAQVRMASNPFKTRSVRF